MLIFPILVGILPSYRVILAICFLIFWFVIAVLAIRNDTMNIRNKYEKKLKKYYRDHKPRIYLINEYCVAQFFKPRHGAAYFYVKERGINKIGKYFELKGDNNHVTTMWAFFDMEFSASMTYEDLRLLYMDLNGKVYGPYFREYPDRYEIHDKWSKTVKYTNLFIKNKMAQNEYCRMELKILSSGEKVIICSEIWGTPDYDKPRKFVIKALVETLYDILNDMQKNPMFDYDKLFDMYKNYSDYHYTGCLVYTLEDYRLEDERAREVKKKEQEIMQEKQCRNHSKKKQEEKPEQNSEENKEIHLLLPPNLPPPKYDERNLDI